MIVEVGGGSGAKPIKIEIRGATPDDIKASVERLGSTVVGEDGTEATTYSILPSCTTMTRNVSNTT